METSQYVHMAVGQYSGVTDQDLGFIELSNKALSNCQECLLRGLD